MTNHKPSVGYPVKIAIKQPTFHQNQNHQPILYTDPTHQLKKPHTRQTDATQKTCTDTSHTLGTYDIHHKSHSLLVELDYGVVSRLRYRAVHRAKIFSQLNPISGAHDSARDELASVHPRQRQLCRSQPNLLIASSRVSCEGREGGGWRKEHVILLIRQKKTKKKSRMLNPM